MKNVTAGAWFTCVVCRDLMKHSSSAIAAVCGRKSLTVAPLWPWREKFEISPSTGRAVWPPVIVLKRLPATMLSGICVPCIFLSIGL